jgi:L-fuculose-phosphate aldolase
LNDLNDDACTIERGLRLDLVRFSKWLSRLGFTPGTSGNLSVRLDENRILATPTSVSKGLVKAADMVIVDRKGNLLTGTRRVTSELSMHLAVYDQRADVRAVIHSHPPIATAFACSGKALDEMLCQEAVMTVGTVPLARYATTGTTDVAASLRPYISQHEAILLENHGAVSYGKTLLEAFMTMETVEHLAHVALIAHQLGSAKPLRTEQVEELQRARSKYLQNAGEMNELGVLRTPLNGTHSNADDRSKRQARMPL